MNSLVYWHWPTFFMYILMGVQLAYACNANNRYSLCTGVRYKLFNRRFIGVFIVWVIIGVFRLVDGYHGGTDTPGYILGFENAFNPNYYSKGDIAFQFLKMAVRYISSDYHVFFFVIYGIWMTVYLLFIKTFTILRASTIPLVLLPYLFYVGFSSMRSSMASVWLLLSIIFVFKNKYSYALIFSIISCLTHVSMMMYAPVIVFYSCFKKLDIKIYHIFVGLFLFCLLGVFVQNMFLIGSFAFLQDSGSGAYEAYVNKNVGKDIMDTYVIYLPSISISMVIIFLWKSLNEYMNLCGEFEKTIIKALLLICLFDSFMAPIASILGVYRGYQYLMLPRLLMWGIIIDIIRRKYYMISPAFINICFTLFFIAWIWSRFHAMYESSQLMPYVLDLF